MAEPVIYGDTFPNLVSQLTPETCLSASFEAVTDVPQTIVTKKLQRTEGILDEDGGFLVGTPTSVVAEALNGLIEVKQVIEPHPSTMYYTSHDSALDRVNKIFRTIENNDGFGVVLAAPRQRKGEQPFLHAWGLTGMEITDDDTDTIGIDPSEIDGSARKGAPLRLSLRQLIELVTPTPFDADSKTAPMPVYAYGARELS